jgi:hypothetical protein
VIRGMTSVTRPGDRPKPSTGELVKQFPEQVSRLAREEMRLAQLEMSRKGMQAGLGIGVLGGSGLTALYAVGCLLETGTAAARERAATQAASARERAATQAARAQRVRGKSALAPAIAMTVAAAACLVAVERKRRR